jgi:Pyruvate/2-oxoacid:ferredoxin oxidoreductase gamma subunit
VAFNGPSLARFGPAVLPGGVVVYDASAIREAPALPPAVRVVPVRCSEIARELGEVRTKNIVALGALQAAVPLLPQETFLAAIRDGLGAKAAALAGVNEEAFRRGGQAVRSLATPS